MKVPFWKMHGAANDFIVVDDRALTFPAGDRAWLAAIMARRTGVGSEGVLLIQPSARADFCMRFFNPDGGEVDMCGNGARCIARLAHELGAAPARMSFETAAGLVRAEVRGAQVLLGMTEPKDWRLRGAIELRGGRRPCHFVNSGVPHAVLTVDRVDDVDVQGLGSAIRHHADFAPAGTNANFIEVTGPGAIRVRTYERGVEAETLACGTGIVASALVAGKLGLVAPPVRVTPASGDVLEVGYEDVPGGARGVTLLGPAMHVFRGELEHPGS
jgi:diaminopimelate epimerase